MYEELKIVLWPDPVLLRPADTVAQIDASIRKLTDRMLELMREEKGVGLAAPQVGVPLRLFVMNASGNPADDRVYINPQLSEADGTETDEEGCLSLPGVRIKVARDLKLRLKALDLEGKPVDEVEEGFIARVWQHEVDHLDGRLLVHRMGPTAKLSYRKKLKELTEQYEKDHPVAKALHPAKRSPQRGNRR